ncbi:MAG: RNA-binding protein [Nostoc sp.]
MKSWNRWNAEEEELLAKAVIKCSNIDEIHQEYFPYRSRKSVKGKLGLLGLTLEPQWTVEEEEILHQLYSELSPKLIQSQFMPHRSLPAIHAKAQRLNLKQRHRWTREEERYLKDNYLTQTYEKIGQKLGKDEPAVRAKAQQMKLRKLESYTVNHKYFNSPNLKSCYWAGFLAADGCIKYSNHGYIIEIALNEVDVEHLETLRVDLECSHKICKMSNSGKLKKFPSGNKYICGTTFKLRFNSKDICEDLISIFNITPKKSLTLCPPPLEDEQLIKAFIIGLIDGDGGVNLFKVKGEVNSIEIDLTGTKEILDWVKYWFDIWVPNTHYKCANTKRTNSKTYRYHVAGSRGIKLWKMLYQVKVPKLKRKWDKPIPYFS